MANHIKPTGKIKSFLLDLFFPRFCLGCKKEGVYLCQDCQALLDVLEWEYCLCNKNALRLPSTGKCQKCSRKHLAGLSCALSFQENSLTRKLIHQFKYEPYLKDLAKTFSNLIIEHFLLMGKEPADIFKNGVLVPIPLSRKKLKKRGFNQAEEIAKELSQTLDIPLISNNLVKTKETRPQMELSEKERQENIKGVFQIENPRDFKQKKIFLIDDVYTTGATLEEAAQTIKQAGAKSVWGIVAAREG